MYFLPLPLTKGASEIVNACEKFRIENLKLVRFRTCTSYIMILLFLSTASNPGGAFVAPDRRFNFHVRILHRTLPWFRRREYPFVHAVVVGLFVRLGYGVCHDMLVYASIAQKFLFFGRFKTCVVQCLLRFR